jgi:hypothetical protein
MRIIVWNLWYDSTGEEMPDKPTWYARIDQAIRELEAIPWPWVDRQTLQQVLGVGRRRAQQILEPFVRKQVGRNGLAGRDDLIAHLKRVATGETVHYERRRRHRLAAAIREMDMERLHQPHVLVAAPTNVVNLRMLELPAGVSVGAGEITVRFSTPPEALEKLLALAMAIGNDLDSFEQLATAD